jgi:hypothetical protein
MLLISLSSSGSKMNSNELFPIVHSRPTNSLQSKQEFGRVEQEGNYYTAHFNISSLSPSLSTRRSTFSPSAKGKHNGIERELPVRTLNTN